jgi:hypothetical protein
MSPFFQKLFKSQDLEIIKEVLMTQNLYKIDPKNSRFVEQFLAHVIDRKKINYIKNNNLRFGNHVLGMHHLSRKHQMAINVVNYCSQNGLDSSEIIPETHIINKITWKEDLNQFKSSVNLDSISK